MNVFKSSSKSGYTLIVRRGNDKKTSSKRTGFLGYLIIFASANIVAWLVFAFSSYGKDTQRQYGSHRGSVGWRLPVPWGKEAENVNSTFEDSVVLATKTGYMVAFDRIPIHLAEKRTDQPNQLFYADADLTVGDAQIKDILAGVSDTIKAQPAFQAYHALHHSLDKGEQPANEGLWAVDRYKNLRVLGDAWREYPDKKWYITRDGDTFLFWSTILRWLRQFDPSEQHYFGKFADKRGGYAQGGSGYIVSKGLVDATFGKDKDFDQRFDQLYADEDWGDAAFAKAILSPENVKLTRPNGGDPMFTESPSRWLIFSKATWYSPLFSLHRLKPKEMQEMRDLELKVEQREKKEGDVRYCDIFERLELPSFLRNDTDWLRGVSKPGQEVVKVDWAAQQSYFMWEGGVRDHAHCRRMCDFHPECFSWLFKEATADGREPECMVHYLKFTIGEKSTGAISGWRLDRIAKFIKENQCTNRQKRNIGFERSLLVNQTNIPA